MVVFNVSNSSQMFGTPLTSAQSSSVLSHVSSLFLVLLAFLFLWFVLTIIVTLLFVNKGKKKGQVLWVFIVSLIILMIILIVAFVKLDSILLWLGGLK